MSAFRLHGYFPRVIDARMLSTAQRRAALDYNIRMVTVSFWKIQPIDRLSHLTREEKQWVLKRPSKPAQAKSRLARELAGMTKNEREQWAIRTQYARGKFTGGQRVWHGDGPTTPCSDADLYPDNPARSMAELKQHLERGSNSG